MPLAEETDEQLAHATADDGAGVGGSRPDDLSHLAAIAGAGPHDSITLTIEAPAPPSPTARSRRRASRGGGGGAGRKMTELDPRFNPDLADESEVETEFSELSAQRGQISITERTMSTGAKGI